MAESPLGKNSLMENKSIMAIKTAAQLPAKNFNWLELDCL